MALWRHSPGCARLLLLFALGLGCARSPVDAPRFSPGAAARKAMAQCDANRDGSLDAAELARCPGLKAAAGSIDADRNGSLKESEIAARVTKYRDSPVVVLPFQCRVLYDDHPRIQ